MQLAAAELLVFWPALQVIRAVLANITKEALRIENVAYWESIAVAVPHLASLRQALKEVGVFQKDPSSGAIMGKAV